MTGTIKVPKKEVDKTLRGMREGDLKGYNVTSADDPKEKEVILLAKFSALNSESLLSLKVAITTKKNNKNILTYKNGAAEHLKGAMKTKYKFGLLERLLSP